MGYDLHITRRKNWYDAGADITAEEWFAYVKSDPDLKLSTEQGCYFAIWANKSAFDGPWLDWSDGRIYSKFPDAALIDKMVAIAKHFGATVQGDDGEIYDGGNLPPREQIQAPPSFRERVASWFGWILWRIRPIKYEQPELTFGVGDIVRDLWGNEHRVIDIDRKAGNGIGIIRTIRECDGAEIGHMLITHNLTLVAKKKDE